MAAATDVGDSAELPLPARIRRARELREAILALPRAPFPEAARGRRFADELDAYLRAKGVLIALRVDGRRAGLPQWQAGTAALDHYDRTREALRAIIGADYTWLIDVDDTVKRAEAALDSHEREEIDEWVARQREAVDSAHHTERIRQQEREAIYRTNGAVGGRGGRNKAKRQHTELFWRAATAIQRAGESPTPAKVRAAVKRGWQTLAMDVGDPLTDIVNINVRGGVIDVEYTEKWAGRGRRSRFIEVDDAALRSALRRRPKDL